MVLTAIKEQHQVNRKQRNSLVDLLVSDLQTKVKAGLLTEEVIEKDDRIPADVLSQYITGLLSLHIGKPAILTHKSNHQILVDGVLQDNFKKGVLYGQLANSGYTHLIKKDVQPAFGIAIHPGIVIAPDWNYLQEARLYVPRK